jgi:hypothetical protein
VQPPQLRHRVRRISFAGAEGQRHELVDAICQYVPHQVGRQDLGGDLGGYPGLVQAAESAMVAESDMVSLRRYAWGERGARSGLAATDTGCLISDAWRFVPDSSSLPTPAL